MTTVLIESNRLLATAAVEREIAEEDTGASEVHPPDMSSRSKSTWSTSIASGLTLPEGTEISMHSAMVNCPAAGSEQMMFTGKGGFRMKGGAYKTDNQTTLSMGYWISNNMQYAFSLPNGSCRVCLRPFISTNGLIDLSGEWCGLGDVKAGDLSQAGTDAGYEAFSRAYPMRAFEAVEYCSNAASPEYESTGDKRATLEDAQYITSPRLTSSFIPPHGPNGGPAAARPFRQWTPSTKGHFLTMNPSCHRFYLPDTRIEDLHHPGKYKISTGPVFGVEGMPSWKEICPWKMLVRKVPMEIEPQNTTPQRLGSILTQQCRERIGNAISWREATFPAGRFELTPPLPAFQSTESTAIHRHLTFTPVTQIVSNCYLTWPTTNGEILHRRMVNNQFEPWSAAIDNEMGLDHYANANAGYSEEEGYSVFFKNILSANPFHWETLCNTLPFLQKYAYTAQSFNSNTPIYGPISGNSKKCSLYTGELEVVTQERYHTNLNYHISVGLYGNFPCCMQDDLPYLSVTVGNHPVRMLDTSHSYLYNNEHTDHQYWSYMPAETTKFLSLPVNYVIATNMNWDFEIESDDGLQVEQDIISRFNDHMDNIQAHLNELGATGSSHSKSAIVHDSPEGQSPAFFNGTVVPWMWGRLNDSMSFPNGAHSGIKGMNSFLPNSYATYYANLPGHPPLPDGVVVGTHAHGGSYIHSYIPDIDEHSGGQPLYLNGLKEVVSWGTWDNSLEPQNNEAAQRVTWSYRFLPIRAADKLPPTADNLYHNKCSWMTLGNNYKTGPDHRKVSFTKYLEYYNKMAKLNGGKGMGIIPIFWWNAPTESIRYVPFIGVIVGKEVGSTTPPPGDPTTDKARECLWPWISEYFMLASSPSLVQNLVAVACTTQKNYPTNYPGGCCAAWNSAAANKPFSEGTTQSDMTSYPSSICVGANDGPLFEFDTSLSRFTTSQWYTPTFRGNGSYQNGGTSGPNVSPETIEETSLAKCAHFSSRIFQQPYNASGEQQEEHVFCVGSTSATSEQPYSIMPFSFLTAKQTPYPILSSQSGVSLVEMSVDWTDGTPHTLNRWDANGFKYTMLDKMGFEFNTLIPLSGSTNCTFARSNYTRYAGLDQSMYLQYMNMMFPMTVGNAYINSSAMPSFVQGFGPQAQREGQEVTLHGTWPCLCTG